MKALSTAGATLFAHAEGEEVASLPLAGGHAAVASFRSPDKDTPNEDCALLVALTEDAAVIAVADGLGGLPAGEQASRVALETLAAALGQARADGLETRTAILDGIEAANRAVLALGTGAATTLAVVEIEGRRIRPYHVGDSIILLAGQRGRMRWQTVPHSPVGFAVESGMLNQSDAMHHEDRHIVSNVIGSNQMRIEIGPPLALNPFDTLLVASDGLFDNLHLDEIVERMRKGPLQQAVERLVRDARTRMTDGAAGAPSKPDDLTAVAYRLPGKRHGAERST
ncbi:MAG: protein phosphatase 2C domain-containing protein [Gammaproteobacteria bacterium]|nr:protein phosphatase 2C domain-containing protein [Gammaproteobacteria bacterium]